MFNFDDFDAPKIETSDFVPQILPADKWLKVRIAKAFGKQKPEWDAKHGKGTGMMFFDLVVEGGEFEDKKGSLSFFFMSQDAMNKAFKQITRIAVACGCSQPHPSTGAPLPPNNPENYEGGVLWVKLKVTERKDTKQMQNLLDAVMSLKEAQDRKNQKMQSTQQAPQPEPQLAPQPAPSADFDDDIPF